MGTFSTVTLPTGKEVQAIMSADNIPSECFKDGYAGYAAPKLFLPYAKNPRRYMDPDEHASLRESVSAVGVKELVKVMPVHLAKWLQQDTRGLPYINNTGHRRSLAAIQEKVPAIPFVVETWDNEADFFADAVTSNKGQVKPTPLEEGYEYQSMLNMGMKFVDLCKREGKKSTPVYNRLALTKLAPDIQEELDPTIKTKKRLALIVAYGLGYIKDLTADELEDELEAHNETGDIDPSALSADERRFTLQRLRLTYFKASEMSAVEGAEYCKTGKKSTHKGTGSHGPHMNGGGSGPINLDQAFEGLNVRDQLVLWAKIVCQAEFAEMKPDELQRAFEYAVREDLEALAKVLEIASGEVVGIAKLLQTQAAKKTRTHPEVLKRAKASKERNLLNSLHKYL